MNNTTLSIDDFTLDQDEIDDLWNAVNNPSSDSFHYWISLLSFTFAILGTLSNLMSIVVLIKLSTHLSTFVYLTGLSTSDMITCLTVMIMHLFEYVVQTRLSTSLTIFLRQMEIVFGAFAAGSRVLSFWISTAVTMDRWILICYPIYGKKICTLYRAKVVSITLFIIAFIYSVPLCFEYEIIEMPSVYQMINFNNESISLNNDKHIENSILVTKGYSDLAKRRIYRWSYMFFNAIFVYTFPTITIIFSNIQLIRALHRLKSRRKRLSRKSVSEKSSNPNPNNHYHHHQQQQHNRNHRRCHHSKYSVTIMVIAMVLTLLLCRSPTIVLWVLWSFELTIKIFFDSSSSSVVRRFHNIANLIAIVNAATNFLPFCVFGQLFRTECLAIYCCRKPTSEQLAKQAKRKYNENSQHFTKTTRVKLIIDEQQTTHFGNDHLKTTVQSVQSVHSDSTTGQSRSSNELPHSTNLVRLSDPPINIGIHL